jgi:cell division protein FtsX
MNSDVTDLIQRSVKLTEAGQNVEIGVTTLLFSVLFAVGVTAIASWLTARGDES